jgi:hypothetical protein
LKKIADRFGQQCAKIFMQHRPNWFPITGSLYWFFYEERKFIINKHSNNNKTFCDYTGINYGILSSLNARPDINNIDKKFIDINYFRALEHIGNVLSK